MTDSASNVPDDPYGEGTLSDPTIRLEPGSAQAAAEAARAHERGRISQLYRDLCRAESEQHRGIGPAGFANRTRWRLEFALGVIPATDPRLILGVSLHWADEDRCCMVGPRGAGQPICDRPYGHHWESTRHGLGDQEW
jgi:hypothetical protein